MPQDLSAVAWPVRTERLTIRPATSDDDIDATWAFRQLPEVSEWLTQAHADRDAYALAFLDRADHRQGRRNLWLRGLDAVGLGFDS